MQADIEALLNEQQRLRLEDERHRSEVALLAAQGNADDGQLSMHTISNTSTCLDLCLIPARLAVGASMDAPVCSCTDQCKTLRLTVTFYHREYTLYAIPAAFCSCGLQWQGLPDMSPWSCATLHASGNTHCAIPAAFCSCSRLSETGFVYPDTSATRMPPAVWRANSMYRFTPSLLSVAREARHVLSLPHVAFAEDPVCHILCT
eukprot:1157924-Pelagomonas_calceolata.AAC.14